MPNLDGLDAARAIRALPGWAGIPIIAMTANAFDEDRLAATQAGMNDHVAKPVDPRQFFGTLLKWLPDTSPRSTADETAPTPDSPLAEADAGQGLRARLAAVPDLDMAAGLALVRGKFSSYRRILKLFVESHDADESHLSALIRQGDLIAAEKISHALKGAAGAIGARTIHAQASTLDLALKRGDGAAAQAALIPLAERLPGLVDALKTALAEA
jgi:CheY-like chemotaxis protein